MMSLDVPALSVPANEDLLPLTALLHQQGLVHRIYEANGHQQLMVATAEEAEAVQELYRRWRAGEVRIELSRKAPPATPYAAAAVWHRPATLVLIALSLAGFAVIYFGAPVQWLRALTFTPFDVVGGSLRQLPMDGAPWRWITPAFLHFGWLHVTFNCLWLWDLGGRVEQRLGSLHLLLLVLTIAAVSNYAQYAFGGPAIFGGMSGVVYGLLGFSWVGSRIRPSWQLEPPRAVMLLMIGWLLLCLAGLVEALGFGAIANAAHLGGLLAGAALGAIFASLGDRG